MEAGSAARTGRGVCGERMSCGWMRPRGVHDSALVRGGGRLVRSVGGEDDERFQVGGSGGVSSGQVMWAGFRRLMDWRGDGSGGGWWIRGVRVEAEGG